jgi:hypothetical protein
VTGFMLGATQTAPRTLRSHRRVRIPGTEGRGGTRQSGSATGTRGEATIPPMVTAAQVWHTGSMIDRDAASRERARSCATA